jgi:hypothetical protein
VTGATVWAICATASALATLLMWLAARHEANNARKHEQTRRDNAARIKADIDAFVESTQNAKAEARAVAVAAAAKEAKEQRMWRDIDDMLGCLRQAEAKTRANEAILAARRKPAGAAKDGAA